MPCAHISRISTLSQPKLSQQVHREECTQCFDSQDMPTGIDLCLSCFNGACPRLHAQAHVHKSEHPFSLNIRRAPAPPPTGGNGRDESGPPAKMAKLAIQEEPTEKEKYQFLTTIKCWICDSVNGTLVPEAVNDPKVKTLIDACMSSHSSARQSEIRAWEEEIVACEHTLLLEQFETGPIAESGLAHCTSCDLTANLWLCLTCGKLGCGRKQAGGLEGHGHALAHYQDSHHSVSVKLGTITPEGGADIYCYACDDARQDPEIAAHLRTFGINIQSLAKTEKSMTELQIEHNLQYDFSLTSHSGEALEPVCGPGLTGLANLGNSCYIASVLQTIFSLPYFQQRYFQPDTTHAQQCKVALPADCLECQMRKLADGLLSGRYAIPQPTVPRPKTSISASEAFSSTSTPDVLSHPIPPSSDPEHPLAFQAGIRPNAFKTLIGKNHAEFSTMRQQDAEEFFAYFLKRLREDSRRLGIALGEDGDATRVFKYGMEQRLQCQSCKKVRYRVDEMDTLSVQVPAEEEEVPTNENSEGGEKKHRYKPVKLTSCIASFLSPEALHYTCPAENTQVIATKSSQFASFPDVLVVHVKKFKLVNWVPTKLDIPVMFPDDDVLVFDESYLGSGLRTGEVEIPDDARGGAASGLPSVNEELVTQLEMMGFPRVRCEKALRATGNNDAESAMEWIFAHMEDPDIDVSESAVAQQSTGGAPEAPLEMVGMLTDMGFTVNQAKKALRETDNNAERAVDWLFNHPDDLGEDVPQSSSEPSNATQQIGGSTTVPVRYVLKAFVSHKGPSVHSGHYVAHVKMLPSDDGPGGWVLFNDEKVVKADAESVDELKQLAYLYVFEKA